MDFDRNKTSLNLQVRIESEREERNLYFADRSLDVFFPPAKNAKTVNVAAVPKLKRRAVDPLVAPPSPPVKRPAEDVSPVMVREIHLFIAGPLANVMSSLP